MKGVFLCVTLVLQVFIVNGGFFDCPATGIHFFSHPTTCSKFIQCLNGHYNIFPCGDNLHFNPILGWCQPQDEAGCTIDEDIAEDDDDYGIVESTTAEASDDEIKDSDEYPPADDETEDSEQYPPIDDEIKDSGEYPSIDDENYPDDEIEASGEYPPSNEIEDSGEYPPNDDEIEDSGEYPPIEEDNYPDSEIGDSGENGDSGSSEIEIDDENIVVNCPAIGQYFLPHPRTCSRFIKCNDGIFRVVECVDGLHFDSTWGWCDEPDVVNCILPDKDDDDISPPESICPATGQYFFPHPTSCSQFLKCNNGDYREVECVDGLHFDQVMGWCDEPAIANCTIDESTTEGSLVYCPDDTQHFFPHPSRCSQFLECNFGRYVVIDCIPGLHFNPKSGHCDFPSNVGCILEDEPESLVDCPTAGQYFYPYPNSCEKFIECNRGEYKVMDCIYGLHFDSTKGYCDFPITADCRS